MKKYNFKVSEVLRFLVGLMILVHGLYRILTLGRYMEFVMSNFNDVLPLEYVLTVGSALFPFVEFFAGLLLLFRVGLKRTLLLGFLISVIMSVFIIVAGFYPRLIYHGIVITMLSIVYYRESCMDPGLYSFNYSKGKINSRRSDSFGLW